MRITNRPFLSFGLAALLVTGSFGQVLAQTSLPELTVPEPDQAPLVKKKKPVGKHKATAPAQRSATPPASAAATPTATSEAATANGAADDDDASAPAPFTPTADDKARGEILTRGSANASSLDGSTINALPQSDNAPIEKTLLQTPGFSQDSAVSGSFHLRNEHANVQFRINGILLPDGVSGFSQVIDSGIIGDMDVLDGALPAEFGLHTSGIVDITTRNDAFNNSGSVSVYGGSQGLITPSFEYGGSSGFTNYFVSGRYVSSQMGIENTTPSTSAIHDDAEQQKFFSYASTRLDDGGRFTMMTGIDAGQYQIPNNPGQPQNWTVDGYPSYSSSQINENQYERNIFNVAAYQTTVENLQYQLSFFSRYSDLHFEPDPVGDLIYNGVASDVKRESFLNGVAADASLKLNPEHTLRFGLSSSGEWAGSSNSSTAFPVDADGNQAGDAYALGTDTDSHIGFLASAYLQDEWKINPYLTMNAGLRFDQMNEYVSANQLSPRLSLTWKPIIGTTIHAGYARYFTPPELALSGPTNLALTNGTTQQPDVATDDPVLPERSNVFDVGVDEKLTDALSFGLDAYYKQATNLIDDGQFGAANTLTAFNYAKGYNDGVEGKIDYDTGRLHLYGNLAWGIQKATNIVSNQYLISQDDLNYIANNYIFTDHAQMWTGSLGAAYRWQGYTFSADAILGSGLRAGDDNLGTVPGYAQVNIGIAKQFKLNPTAKPTTIRFDVVNLLDHVYEIRDGTGVGVFAPQYGPRRGFFVGLTQAL